MCVYLGYILLTIRDDLVGLPTFGSNLYEMLSTRSLLLIVDDL